MAKDFFNLVLSGQITMDYYGLHKNYYGYFSFIF